MMEAEGVGKGGVRMTPGFLVEPAVWNLSCSSAAL